MAIFVFIQNGIFVHVHSPFRWTPVDFPSFSEFGNFQFQSLQTVLQFLFGFSYCGPPQADFCFCVNLESDLSIYIPYLIPEFFPTFGIFHFFILRPTQTDFRVFLYKHVSGSILFSFQMSSYCAFSCFGFRRKWILNFLSMLVFCVSSTYLILGSPVLRLASVSGWFGFSCQFGDILFVEIFIGPICSTCGGCNSILDSFLSI